MKYDFDKFMETEHEWATHFGYLSRNQRFGYNFEDAFIVIENFFPWSCFKEPISRVIVSSFYVAFEDPIMDLARKFGAEWEVDPYCETDDKGWPVWFGNSDKEEVLIRKCIDFLNEYDKQKNA